MTRWTRPYDELSHQPYWLMVFCMLGDDVPEMFAVIALESLMRRCEKPEDVLRIDIGWLTIKLRTVGNARLHAQRLREFTRAWLDCKPECAEDIVKMPFATKHMAKVYKQYVK